MHSPCANCAAWNEPQQPFRIYGDTYYVGTHGLGSVLITSATGHILIDGALPESAQLIAANIRALGFRIKDIKLILNSHAHFDHAGGIAELQRLSGARVAVSQWAAEVMNKGAVLQDDPQFGTIVPIAKVARVSHAWRHKFHVAVMRARPLSQPRLCRQLHTRISRWLPV
jgi:metallo-beta-lactamase class B